MQYKYCDWLRVKLLNMFCGYLFSVSQFVEVMCSLSSLRDLLRDRREINVISSVRVTDCSDENSFELRSLPMCCWPRRGLSLTLRLEVIDP